MSSCVCEGGKAWCPTLSLPETSSWLQTIPVNFHLGLLRSREPQMHGAVCTDLYPVARRN